MEGLPKRSHRTHHDPSSSRVHETIPHARFAAGICPPAIWRIYGKLSSSREIGYLQKIAAAARARVASAPHSSEADRLERALRTAYRTTCRSLPRVFTGPNDRRACRAARWASQSSTIGFIVMLRWINVSPSRQPQQSHILRSPGTGGRCLSAGVLPASSFPSPPELTPLCQLHRVPPHEEETPHPDYAG